jgi:hypothetical protein
LFSSLRKVIKGACWLGLAYFLGSTQAAGHSTLRILAAALLALPVARQVVGFVVNRFAQLSDSARRDLEELLHDQLIAIQRAKVYDGDVSRVSFHVWTLPQGYQLMLNFRWYRKIIASKRDYYKVKGIRSRRIIDPTLKRAAKFGLQRPPPNHSSGVRFRNGEGIIGRCIVQNLAGKVMTVALNSKPFQEALQSDETWSAASEEIRQNIRRRSAQKLAANYGQVAAVVLQNSGHAFGCVTLDLPWDEDSKTRLTTDEQGHPEHALLEHLLNVAEKVEHRLTRSLL